MDSTSARLFIAAYPPPETTRMLCDRLGAIQPLPDHRRVPIGDVHLTVYFIGELPREHVPLLPRGIAPVVARHAPIDLEVDRLITLPPRRPRLIAAGAKPSTALSSLNDALCRLFEERAPSGKSRMDIPHLTLCRFKKGARTSSTEIPIDPIRWSLREIHLVESKLDSSGAVHSKLASFELGAEVDQQS